MATVLLVGAGLLINSFVKLSTTPKGYDPSHALAVQLVFPAGDYPMNRRADTIDALLERFRTDPNVQFAGFSRAGVLIGEEIHMGVLVPPGRTVAEMRAEPPLRIRSITTGFLPAMGIHALDGRDLDDADASAGPLPIVVTRSAAVQLFGRSRGVGQTL